MRLFRNHSLRRLVRELPFDQLIPFAIAIFGLFAVLGPVTDIFNGGRQNIWLLISSTVFSGAVALGYGLGTMRGNRWLLGGAIAAQLLWFAMARDVFARLPQNAPGAASARVAADAGGVLILTMISYSCFLWFINGAAARYLRVRAEIELAHQVHAVLVPRIATIVGSFEFVGFSKPSGEVGGDLVDVVSSGFPAASAGWFGYVADVSGHGVSSGVVMGMFKSALRMRLRQAGSLAELLSDLNTVLFPLKTGSMFVTVACLRFTGRDTLDFAVAGHLPILRVRGGAVDEITTPQIPIAMFETYPFVASTVDVRSGDLLALITDGLIEVFDAEDRDFGLERAKSLLAQNDGIPLSEIADRLVSAARAHGRQLDDQTLLLIRRT
jgi:sigma-B regulation protein RsbU (phosphoserine phosphatase)